MTLLTLSGLSVGYFDAPVVRDLDLHVNQGEVVALLGPNGAGKTTTLMAISGLLPAMSGSISVLDLEPSRRNVHRLARSGLAHVPEDRALFYQLTVAENLRLARRPKGQSLSAALESVLGYFPALQPLMRRRAGLLSGGEQQMLVLARALITKPRVLMVDEMSLGLAPLLVQPLLEVLRRVADEDGTAVLVVEQHVHSILRVADRAYVLNHGTLVLEGPAAELAQRDDVLRASYLGEAELEPSSSSSKHRGPLV